LTEEAVPLDILILSVSAGGGHVKASQTIKKYMETHFEKINVEIIDWLKYINPVVDRVVIGGYIGTLKASPSLYEKLYNIAEKEEGISDISLTINRLLAMKMEGLINNNSPKVVVCTHPFPLEVICYLKRRNNLPCKVVSLLTDYAPHSFWIREGVDCYIIPNEDLIYEMEWKGVDRNRIYPLGIPIDEGFLESYDPIQTRTSLGLDRDKTTLLIMGGSLGMGEVKEVFKRLTKSSLHIQMIVVCGKNKKLKESIETLAPVSSKPSIVLGYTEEIPRLMAASDLLITKPGGLTISEAMAMKLPIAIISPIPGQEERNARYLMNSGMAIRFKSNDYVEGIIRQLLDSPVRLRHMKEIAGLKAKPHSTREICSLLMKML
jgi:processive 1,2-diacylglycerol beta-glucosyltransferase